MKGGSFNYSRMGSIDVAAIVRQPEVKCGNIFAGMWARRFEMHDKIVALLNCVLKFMIRLVQSCDSSERPMGLLTRLDDLQLSGTDGSMLARDDVVDHQLAWSIYFLDPDGNRFELTTYDYEAVAEQLKL
jgi:hypothetical protein